MKLEDIKVGEIYNIQVKVIGIDDDSIHVFYADATDLSGLHIKKQRAGILSPIPQEKAPKYDPRRKFRKGDIVKIVEWRGRRMADGSNGGVYTVQEDEKTNDYKGVSIKHETKGRLIGWARVHACNLELVTPVEELEPYIVKKYSTFFAVEKRNNHKDRPATYDLDFHPNAKAAAEAERDRLNAEYRKEQK